MTSHDRNEIDKQDDHVDKEIVSCLSLDLPRSFFLFAGAGSGKTRSLIGAIDHIRSQFSLRLRLRNQKVAVVTYTKAARDEIIRRSQFDPVVSVSTIHSFAWFIVQGFNRDIREWLRVELANDIARLTAEEAKGRKGTKASAQRLADIASAQRRLGRLDSIRQFVYSPDGDNFGKDSLNHAEVLKIAGAFVRTKPTLRQIIVDGHPFILVDESQDTNKHIVEALFVLQAAHQSDVVVGLFGDMMQRIYGDGQPDLGKDLPPDWARPTKKLNFRCPRRVVRLLNKLRETTDRQEQAPCSAAVEGHVRLFVLPQDGASKTQVEGAISSYMAVVTGDDEWKSIENVKTLILEHHMAASRMGFPNLLATLYPISRFRTGLLDGTLSLITFFSNLILPLLDARHDKFAIARIIRAASPLASADALRDSFDEMAQLEKAQEAVDALIALFVEGSARSFRDVLECVASTGLFSIPERLKAAMDRRRLEGPSEDLDEEDGEEGLSARDAAVDAFLGVSFDEIRPYKLYVESKARFDTHQGVKGLEFPRVMVVMDDSEARGFLFKYEKLFDASASEDGTMASTRRLFYVTCSRAERSLALVAYSNDPARVKSHVVSRGWFQADEVHIGTPSVSRLSTGS